MRKKESKLKITKICLLGLFLSISSIYSQNNIVFKKNCDNQLTNKIFKNYRVILTLEENNLVEISDTSQNIIFFYREDYSENMKILFCSRKFFFEIPISPNYLGRGGEIGLCFQKVKKNYNYIYSKGPYGKVGSFIFEKW